MKMKVYAIRDVESGFLGPQLDTNHATAKRNFAMMINNNPGVLGFRPADFDLYFIGEYDIDSARMIPADVVEFVVNGASVAGE